MRVVVCVVITILLFGTTRYFGPNRKYTVEEQIGEITLRHEAPRCHTYAIPGDRDRSEAEIGKLGKYSLEVIAIPAPPGKTEIPLRLQCRLKGTEEWIDHPPAEVVPEKEGARAVCRFDLPGYPWTARLYYRFVTPDGDGMRKVLRRDDGRKKMLKFKGPVPPLVLYPHIALMFVGVCCLMLAMWSAAGLIRGREEPAAAKFAWWAWAAMFVGGVLPFGIMMNYYAFDVFWEAVPFGQDVTDNKTQVALVFWGLSAIFLTRRSGRHAGFFTIAAGFLSLAMYLIPHSL